MTSDPYAQIRGRLEKATKGSWLPWKWTGDGKRILIGDGLVEGPNGYEVAEVYSDDCPSEVAIGNAELIAHAPADLAFLLGEVERLTKIGELRKHAVDRWVPCPDHRDKTERGICQVCRAEKAERELAEEIAIVDRIWGLFGRPSYEQLAGRSIYDLITGLQAELAEARARIAYLEEMSGLKAPTPPSSGQDEQ